MSDSDELLQIEENGEKVTLLGTSWSKGKPLTMNLPLDKSKDFSKLLERKSLKTELMVLFGGAMTNRENTNYREKISTKNSEKKKAS